MIVLDEPTVGLSPLMVEGVFVNLQKWTSSGGAVLLAEQNAEAALHFADYGYVLQQGKIVAQGPGARLRENGLLEAAYLGSGDL
jgi:branched-chain amino acid transport system ATP-binding protein